MRGLVCEYAPEGRARGLNRPKVKVDLGPSHGPSRREDNYSVDPVSGAGPSSQGRSEHNQLPYGSPEFVGGHSIGGHALGPSYAASPVMYGSEGSRSGLVTLYDLSLRPYCILTIPTTVAHQQELLRVQEAHL